MRTHRYEVIEKQDAPRQSHRSFMFPECLYLLKRLTDGAIFRVTLSKSLRWNPGEVVELADLVVDEATMRTERSAS